MTSLAECTVVRKVSVTVYSIACFQRLILLTVSMNVQSTLKVVNSRSQEVYLREIKTYLAKLNVGSTALDDFLHPQH